MNYRYMRVFILFDMPTSTKQERREATQLRNFLVSDGFDMLQYSVYSRLCPNRDAAQRHLDRVMRNAPSETSGSIRALLVTENQFTNMMTIMGEKTSQESMVKSQQMVFF